MKSEELYRKYPHLFARRELDKSQSCMHWGISVNEGWLPLIDKMSEEITAIDSEIQYEQIKEKFGRLRVYTHGGIKEKFEDVWFVIEKYEHQSLSVCEICGEPGNMRSGGWLHVSCDKHNENNLPAKDMRVRWIPDTHPHDKEGILLSNLTDSHLANIIRYMKDSKKYSRFHISLYEDESIRRGLVKEFSEQEHPHDEYEEVDGEYVPKN